MWTGAVILSAISTTSLNSLSSTNYSEFNKACDYLLKGIEVLLFLYSLNIWSLLIMWGLIEIWLHLRNDFVCKTSCQAKVRCWSVRLKYCTLMLLQTCHGFSLSKRNWFDRLSASICGNTRIKRGSVSVHFNFRYSLRYCHLPFKTIFWLFLVV